MNEVFQRGETEFGEHLLLGGKGGTDMAGEEGEVAMAMRQGRGRVLGGKGGGLFCRGGSGYGHRLKVVESVGFASRGVKLVKRGWE